MSLSLAIARVIELVNRSARTTVDENALTAVRLQCTNSAYASVLVTNLLSAVATAVAAIEADAAFGDLATETTDALDALAVSAAACVTTVGGV